jgi:hypothetical protein
VFTEAGIERVRVDRDTIPWISDSEKRPAETVDLSMKAGYMPPEAPREVSARSLGEYVSIGSGRIEEDLERYFRLLIEAGRLPASSSPSELVRRVYRSGV